MARYYRAGRGKALSISSLGFPLSEGVLPLLLTGFIVLAGWRATWVALGVATLLSGPWLIRLLLRSGIELDPRTARATTADGRDGRADGGEADADGIGSGHDSVRAWRRWDVLRDPRFWFALPAVLLPAFWITGFFLYQTTIAELKGWGLPLMASAFVAFAAIRVGFTLGVGGAIDRLSARRLLPATLVPLASGIALLWLVDGAWAAYAFMTFLGVTMGMSGAVHAALWAELYGTRHLGAIQAMLGSLMVASTAASPAVVGLVLETGRGLDGLLLGGIVSVVVGAALALRIAPSPPGASKAQA